jgi:hypothetical protein
MAATDNQELTKYIVDRLSESADQNDLILELCNRTGMDWPQAQALLEKVRAENSATIFHRRLPMLVAIAILTFIGGLGILISQIFIFASIIGEFNGPGNKGLYIVDLVYFLIRYAPAVPILIPLGLAMVIGSLIGMRDVWAGILFPDRP